ncbi:MMPL family transporter [Streptomyces enissocaesilis]
MALTSFAAPGRLSNGGYIAEGTEATRTDALLQQRFAAGIPDLVLYVRSPKPADSAEVMRAGQQFTDRVAGEAGVREVVSYWTVGDGRLLSQDGRAALVMVDLRGDEDAAARRAADLVPQLTGAQSEFTVSATGPAWVMAQATELSHDELIRAELLGAPLAFMVLLFVFGSFTAALLPAVIGAVAVAGTFAVLRVLSMYLPLSSFAFNITTALGFGLAVDYALFVVSRYREELAAGAAPHAAVETTMRTVGRTVVFSAGTVVICLAALLAFPLGFLRSLALAGISVVVLAAAATRLVLPAMLVVIGRRIDRLDPFASLRRNGRAGRSAWWLGAARLATGRPVVAGGCAALFLLTLAVPFAHVRLGVTDERVLPEKAESHATATRIGREFPLPWTRALAVLLPDTDAVDQRQDLDAYARRVSALPAAGEVATALGTYRDGRRTQEPSVDSLLYVTTGSTWLSVMADGPPAADEPLVRQLRALPSPGRHLVSGRPARVLDTKDAVLGALPAAAAIVVAAVLLLLFLFTGSVLIPVKAVIMGALSLGASFGAMVYVFQDGHLRTLVGDFTVTGELETSMPILVFGAAFALSVDYELFLISRIQEEYRRTGDHRAAVVAGLARTGRMITVAAVIFAIALLPLVSSSITLLKLVGCGLALAVLIDATVVRGVLVPAFMQLTGHANWWAPRPLAALHRRVGLERRLRHTSEGPRAGLPAARDGERLPDQQTKSVGDKG